MSTARERDRDRDVADRALMALAGGEALLVSHTEKAWQTGTFNGRNVVSRMCFDGVVGVAAGEAFAAMVAGQVYAIPGWIVVDARVKAFELCVVPVLQLTTEVALILVEIA